MYRIRTWFLAAAMVFFGAFPAFAAESGPTLSGIAQNSAGDLVLTMEEPQETEKYCYVPLGIDLSTIGDNGEKEYTFRLMFDENQTESTYNETRTATVVTKVIPAEDIQAALTSESRTLWNNYLAKAGNFIVDGVLAVSNDKGASLSGFLKKEGDTGEASVISNYLYTDIAIILSLDPDGDLVFGEGEEGRLCKVYEWSDPEVILAFYNLTLTVRTYEEETFSPTSHQSLSGEYASLGEKAASYSFGGSPEIAAYHDSREYTVGGETFFPYTDEGPFGMLVPVGGSFLNGITVDSLYGTVDIGLRGAVHTWNFTYDYEYYVVCYTDDWEPYLELRSDSVDVPIMRRAYYFYIWNLDLYDFAGATVENGSYGEAEYENTDLHLVNQDIAIGNDGPVTREELETYLVNEYGTISLTAERPTYEAELSVNSGETIHLSGGESRAVSTYVPNDDEHIEWARIDTDRELGNLGYAGSVIASSSDAERKASETASGRAERKAWQDANEAVGNGADIETDSTRGSGTSFATVKNDYLKIGYAGQVILDGSTRDVVFYDEDDDDDDEDHDNDYAEDYDMDNLPYYLLDVLQVFPENTYETYETTLAFGREMVTVPEGTEAGEYFTGMTAVYEPVLTYLDTTDEQEFSLDAVSARTASGTYEAIKDGYHINEPVTVKPESILDSTITVTADADVTGGEGGEGLTFSGTIEETQLTSEKVTDAWFHDRIQLKLDGTYWLTFSDSEEESGGESTAALQKYIHFPFDVIIYPKGEDEPEYVRCSTVEPEGWDLTAPDSDMGYYWIELDEGVSNLKFTIPSWAGEGIYESAEDGKQIIYRVSTGSNETSSIHSIDCQVSGWLYDFTVLAVDDAETFGEDSDAPIGSWVSFLLNGNEKKTGTKNRMGYNEEANASGLSSYVRKGIDGTVTSSWDTEDTIPFADGKSSRYTGLGSLSKGSSFIFSVKSMSNLWHDRDYLKVTPSFRYISEDGTEYSEGEFTLYTNDYSGKKAGLFQAFPGNSTVSLSLADTGAVSCEDLEFQAAIQEVTGTYKTGETTGPNGTVYGATETVDGGSYRVVLDESLSDNETQTKASKLLETAARLSQNSDMKIGSGLRVFCGSEEDLLVNIDQSRGNTTSLEDLAPTSETWIRTIFDESGNVIEKQEVESPQNESDRRDNMAKVSVQQWFGKYTIPEELFVTTHSEEELLEYANTHGGIDKDCDLFLDGGYLILHFTITSVKEGEEDLCLEGSGLNLNMWEAQGQDLTVNLGGTETELGYGDVAVIDCKRKVSDYTRTNSYLVR